MNEQLDLFSSVIPKFHIGNRRIKLIETFAGIGSQYLALKRIGANVESHRVVEFDKYAIKSFNAVHGTNYETTDIRDIDGKFLDIRNDGCIYLLTYSFPCTDLSLAGLGKGMSKEDWKQGNSTRSGLLWEVERLLDECKELTKDSSYKLPEILLMENVPQVIGKKNIKDFNSWTSKLESLGYSNHIAILNAKDYGIPQNRKRCFMVSILGEYDYEFPKPIELEYVLKDFLEDDVDDKYYLSDSTVDYFINKNVDPEHLEE